MLDLIFDREVKFSIAVERLVAPNGEIGTPAPKFQPTFQGNVKAVHPPGRSGRTVIVVVGVADKDVVFESRDLCHAWDPTGDMIVIVFQIKFLDCVISRPPSTTYYLYALLRGVSFYPCQKNYLKTYSAS
jgi:hypothetical protein